jgi:predicted transcriptional regulator
MKTTVTVTISSDLMVRVKELAKQEDRSVSAMINVLIRESLTGKEKAA